MDGWTDDLKGARSERSCVEETFENLKRREYKLREGEQYAMVRGGMGILYSRLALIWTAGSPSSAGKDYVLAYPPGDTDICMDLASLYVDVDVHEDE